MPFNSDNSASVMIQPIEQFENLVAQYAGSEYAVAVDSCSSALFLCCKWLKVERVMIPTRTFQSVPCAVIHAGGSVEFEHVEWVGAYQLKPYPIWDSACRFTRNMYVKDSFYCLSFQYRKRIPIGKGGMILTNDKDAVQWFKCARFNGRLGQLPREQDPPRMIGWNMYMTPEQAVRGAVLFNELNDHNDDLKFDYFDLQALGIYQ